MRSVRCEIAVAELNKLGFNAVITEDGGLSIQNFKLYAEKELFKVEGAPVPNSENRKDNFYHNYTYPDGIICGWDKILIEKIIIQGEFSNYSRIQAFTLPRDILPKESADIDNLSFMVSFICNKDPGAIPVNVVNENVRINLDGHSTYAPQVLDYLIGLITQEARQYDSEINYISDTGRLIPIVIPYLKLELRKHLLTEKGDIGLLEILRDRDVNTSHSTIDLKLPPLLVKTYIDKICRNDGKLVSIVDRLLKVTEMPNFIATDLDGLKTQANTKIINSLKTNKTPLYMSMTTGGHAFAMMLDFENNQLFLANPAGPSDF
ncbi:MAG TPA: hypothetical protein DCZ80_00770, partial [Legionellales bacterium]|nr:hypothetical protein [Legionellales bacterium]